MPSELPGPDALLVLLFTSGSTGAPKAVQMSQGRAARTVSALGAVFTRGRRAVLHDAAVPRQRPAGQPLPGAGLRAPRWRCGSASLRRRSSPTCDATAAPTSTTWAGCCPMSWPSRSRPTMPTTRWCGAWAPRHRPVIGGSFAGASTVTSWRGTAPARVRSSSNRSRGCRRRHWDDPTKASTWPWSTPRPARSVLARASTRATSC